MTQIQTAVQRRRMLGRLATGLMLSSLIDAPTHAHAELAGPGAVDTPKGFASRHAFVNGFRMHYVEGGAGPVVVLLHGWPQTWWAWRKVMPLLATDFHVIAIDTPGLGDSDVPPDGYDKRGLARHIRALVNGLGHSRFALIGHDLGASVAYAYAQQFPAELTRLAVMDDPIPGLKDWDVVKGKWPRWHFAFHAIPHLPEALVTGRELTYLSWFYNNAFQKGAITDADARLYAAAYARPASLRAGFEYYRACAQDATDNAANDVSLAMPVLALGGDHSPWRSYLHEQLQGRAELLEGDVVPDCGHFIAEEQPDWLARRLRKFL
ncbi:alpha/beta hydrolase [Paraburkholderia fungorum]|uniref:alpha/beta fold hydrolase n=1 Tax=Paraburkholderia fungorum TaxID=134537 RepID=UPI0038B9EFF5